MNRNLIELNENQGITIDEYGNSTIVSKEQNNCSLKEILEKENQLELLNDDLDAANREYKETRSNLKLSRSSNIGTLLGTIFIALMCLNVPTVAIKSTLICCGGFALFTKSILSTVCGLTIFNKKRLKKLNHKIFELENKIPALEKELISIKEKMNYTTLSTDSSKKDYQELVLDNLYTQSKEKNTGKVRVLRLR